MLNNNNTFNRPKYYSRTKRSVAPQISTPVAIASSNIPSFNMISESFYSACCIEIYIYSIKYYVIRPDIYHSFYNAPRIRILTIYSSIGQNRNNKSPDSIGLYKRLYIQRGFYVISFP